MEIPLESIRQNEWTVQWMLLRKLMDYLGKNIIEELTQYTKMAVDGLKN